MIAWIDGDRPIEQIQIGHRVLTPFGSCAVIAAGQTGHRPVVETRELSAPQITQYLTALILFH